MHNNVGKIVPQSIKLCKPYKLFYKTRMDLTLCMFEIYNICPDFGNKHWKMVQTKW